MRQFFNGTEAAFETLREQALEACMVFQDQEMPPGSSPIRARVGFEVDPNDGVALLLVDSIVTYSGEISEIAAWLENHEKRFSNFNELVTWIREDLSRCYVPAESTSAGNDALTQNPQGGIDQTLA